MLVKGRFTLNPIPFGQALRKFYDIERGREIGAGWRRTASIGGSSTPKKSETNMFVSLFFEQCSYW
jgi:hypothetical protein